MVEAADKMLVGDNTELLESVRSDGAGNGISSLNDLENIGDYLSLFGGDLIRRLNDEYVPVHHPGIEETLPLLNEIKRPLFNAQAHVVTALMKGFEKHRRLLLIGEPGTGKTSMSIATFYSLLVSMLGSKGRVIYMVPNHLIKKTKREVGILLNKDLFEVQFLNGYEDVIRLRDSGKMNRKAEKIEVYIIARDTAKLSYNLEPVAKWVERKYEMKSWHDGEVMTYTKTSFRGWVCPDCGNQLMKIEEGSMVPMDHDDFYNKHGKPARRKNNMFCSSFIRLYKKAEVEKDEYRVCGAALWQAKNKDKSSFSGRTKKVTGAAARKVSPADLFKRYFKHKFDLAIGDECHELTGGSAQAHAFHVLMECAKKSIAMTGTLMNGYASNLFELLFRMFPQRLRDMGFQWSDVGKWIDLYGVREKVTKIRKEDGILNSSSNGAKRVSTKEMPAAAPQLFTDLLSDVACFIQMSDMFEVLPDLQEGPMIEPLSGQRRFLDCVVRSERRPGRKKKLKKHLRLLAPAWYLERNLSQVEHLLREAIQEEIANGEKSVLLGSLLSTTLSYPDVPFNFEGVYHPDTKKEIVSPHFRLSDRLLYPKELQLIKFVRERLKAGRKVGVYATFTGKLGTLQRLQMILEERGIKTAVLESDIGGPQREEWIAEREREGIQVLLTNPILVSTGLDLYGFPSLYFYQTGYRLSIVRQASRRHWRIGQKNLCETVYSGYKDTMQELAINLMAAKMNAALALEGQFSQEGLAALTEGSGGSLATELAKRFVGSNIEGVESAESIWGKISIDPSKLTVVAHEAHEMIEVDSSTEIEQSVSKESSLRQYHGSTISEVLLKWSAEVVPSDLHERIDQQVLYAEENILKGYPGLLVTHSSLWDVTLHWNPNESSSTEEEFRRWIFNLTNKPNDVQHHVKSHKEPKSLGLIADARIAKTSSRKYNVTEAQYAFNF